MGAEESSGQLSSEQMHTYANESAQKAKYDFAIQSGHVVYDDNTIVAVVIVVILNIVDETNTFVFTLI